MRAKLAAIALLALPVVADAQPPTFPPVAGSIVPLPPIGLPLPTLGLPLPALGLPPPSRESRIGGPGTAPPVHGRRRFAGKGSPATVIYIVPVFGWVGAPVPPEEAHPTRTASKRKYQEEADTGLLRLRIQPAAVQVYVDGLYAGAPDDFDGELELQAGPHTVEIAAPGYDTVTFDVNIEPGRSVTYRRLLSRSEQPRKPEPPQPAKEAASAAPMTYYVIPGCYVGNVPPADARLPPGCDHNRAVTVKP